MGDAIPDPSSLTEALRQRQAITGTGQQVPFQYSGLPQGPHGDFAKEWLSDFQQRYGLVPYVPNVRGLLPTRELAPLGLYEGPPEANLGPRSSGGPINLTMEQVLSPETWRRALGEYAQIPQAFASEIARIWHGALNLETAAAKGDRSYDVWKDPQIAQAGYENRMELFKDSTSAQSTADLLKRFRQRERDAEWLARTEGVGANVVKAGGMIGGLLADPLTFLPGSVGVKGIQLAERARQGLLTGNELRLLAMKPAVYGSLADGLRSMAVTASFGIAEQALANQLDPTIPAEVQADLLIPVALAGSLSLYAGMVSRWQGRTLAQEIAQHGHMNPPGARDSGFPGRPGGIGTPEPQPPAFDPRLPPQHTADFRAFMKDNALVDDRGEPERFYHGTNRVFDEFDPKRTGKRTGTAKGDEAYWFTHDAEQASTYAVADRGLFKGQQSPNVRPTYLRSENPIDITERLNEAMAAHPAFQAEPKNVVQHIMNERIKNTVLKEIFRDVKKQGHDAALLRSYDNYGQVADLANDTPTVSVIVFDRKNIRAFDQRWDVPKVETPKPGKKPRRAKKREKAS